MFQLLKVNEAIVNGSGNRACGFFSSDACFSDFNTGELKFTPNMNVTDKQLETVGNIPKLSVHPMSISWMDPRKL